MLMAEYDYDMDIAVQREEAAEEAEARGKYEGRLEMLFQLVKNNVLSAAVAAKQAGMELSVFEEK